MCCDAGAATCGGSPIKVFETFCSLPFLFLSVTSRTARQTWASRPATVLATTPFRHQPISARACVFRWAATADAIAASRISSAAFREGNKAARRWEVAGRCARHWRRAAAARAMERRARGSIKPRSEVVAPVSRRNSGVPADVGAFSAPGIGAVKDGGVGLTGGARGGEVSGGFGTGAPDRGGGRGSSRSRLTGDAAAGRCHNWSRGDVGGAGKENSGGGEGRFFPRHSAATAAAPAGESAMDVAFQSPCSPPAHRENRAVVQEAGNAAHVAAIADRRECGFDALQHGYDTTGPLATRPGGFLVDAAASRAGVSRKRSGLAHSPAERWPSLASPVHRRPLGTSLSHTTRERTASDCRRPSSVRMAAPAALASAGVFPLPSQSTSNAAAAAAAVAAGGAAPTRGRDPSLPSFTRSDRGGTSLEEEEEDQAPSTTTIAVSDLTQLPSPRVPAFTGTCSRGDREDAEAAAVAAADVAAACCPLADDSSVGIPGGDSVNGGGRRRPAPRRPLELLLDETARFSATASAGGQRRGRGGSEGVAPPPPPLSTWVVDEMNRLFGVRNTAASGLGTTFGGARGHRGETLRPVAAEAGRQAARSSSRGHGLSWSAGAHAWRETGDGGRLGHHHHHHRHHFQHNHGSVLQATAQQQENTPAGGEEARWSRIAGVPPTPPHGLKLGDERTLRRTQTGPARLATPTLSPSSPSSPVAAADPRQEGPQEGPRNADPASVARRQTPASAATPGEGPRSKEGGDEVEEAAEGRRRSGRPPLSTELRLVTDSLGLGVSTPEPLATDASAAAVAPASSVSSAPLVVGVGHDAIVPRQSSAGQSTSTSFLLEERALEVRENRAARSFDVGWVLVVCGRCAILVVPFSAFS